MKLKTKIENIVYFIDLKQSLLIDDEIAKENGLNPLENLSGYIFTPSKNPEINFMIFSSGKVFLNGITSQSDMESSFWLLLRKLKGLGTKVKLKPNLEIKIQNMMISANLQEYFKGKNFNIDLEKLAQENDADYNPKKFPGVFLRFFSSPQDIGHVPMLGLAVIFRSGKILVGDIKSKEDANLILEKVIEKVK